MHMLCTVCNKTHDTEALVRACVRNIVNVPVWLSGRALRQSRKKVMGSIPREHTY